MRLPLVPHRFAPLLIALLALLASATPAAAEAARVPGTKVTLEPPADFVPAEQFPGFQRAEQAASIMVTELPAPVAEASAAMTREGLASRGMTLLASMSAKVAGRDGLLLHARQTVNGAVFEKWMAVFGDEAQTVMVVGSFPQALARDLSEPVKRAVLSARWDPRQATDPFDGLTFRIAETASLKIANRVSNMLMLTEGGVQGPVAPEDPFALVGTSLVQVEIADVEGFSRQRLALTAEIAGLTNLEGEATRIDGMPAYEIVADALDKQSGKPLRVYQLIAADGRAYFLVQGLVGSAKAERFLPQFKLLARSLKRVR